MLFVQGPARSVADAVVVEIFGSALRGPMGAAGGNGAAIDTVTQFVGTDERMPDKGEDSTVNFQIGSNIIGTVTLPSGGEGVAGDMGPRGLRGDQLFRVFTEVPTADISLVDAPTITSTDGITIATGATDFYNDGSGTQITWTVTRPDNIGAANTLLASDALFRYTDETSGSITTTFGAPFQAQLVGRPGDNGPTGPQGDDYDGLINFALNQDGAGGTIGNSADATTLANAGDTVTWTIPHDVGAARSNAIVERSLVNISLNAGANGFLNVFGRVTAFTAPDPDADTTGSITLESIETFNVLTGASSSNGSVRIIATSFRGRTGATGANGDSVEATAQANGDILIENVSAAGTRTTAGTLASPESQLEITQNDNTGTAFDETVIQPEVEFGNLTIAPDGSFAADGTFTPTTYTVSSTTTRTATVAVNELGSWTGAVPTQLRNQLLLGSGFTLLSDMGVQSGGPANGLDHYQGSIAGFPPQNYFFGDGQVGGETFSNGWFQIVGTDLELLIQFPS